MAFTSGKNAKLLVKQYDLTQYFQEVTAGSTADELDTTTFGSAYRSFIGGFVDGSMGMTGFYDPVVGGPDDALFDMLDDATPAAISFFPEGYGTLGNTAFVLSAVETRYETGAGLSAPVPAAGAFVGSGGTRWGKVLTAAAQTDTGVTPTGSAVNLVGINNPTNASTAKGLRAHLHVPSNAYNQSTTFRVEHSADSTTGSDGTWAALVTFTAVPATTVTSEVKEINIGTTVNKWLRASYTGAAGAGTLKFAIAINRGF
jgi:hypothetical protein